MGHSNIGASIFRTTALVAAINILSKVLGVGREALVAGSFGAGPATDAFFTAWRLPDVLFNSLIGVLVANTFIPVHYQVAAAGQEASRRFTASATGAALLALAPLAAAYAWFAPQIMPALAPGMDDASSALAAGLARLLAPVALAGAVTGIARSLLHAERSFLPPAWLPVVQNACVIASVWLFGRTLGVAAMAWALLASSLAQAAMLAAPLARRGLFPWPAVDPADPGLKRMGSLMLPVLATFALGNVIPLLEVFLASQAAPGAISHLSYAYRLFTLPEQIFALALSAVLFPYLARDASQGDRLGMTRKFEAGMRLSLYLMLPAGVFLAVFASQFVRLFLGWGAFDQAAVAGTGLTLAAYAGGLFAVCARNLLVDACFAIVRPGIILKAAAAMIPVNAALDWLLCPRLGAPGLSLGFSLTAVIHCAVLYAALRPRLEGMNGTSLLAALARAMLASAVMGAGCLLARPWLAGWMPGAGATGRAAALGLAAAGAGLVYAVAQAVLRSPEQALLARALRRGRG